MNLQEVIDRLEKLKSYPDVRDDYPVCVEGYTSDGTGCVGATEISDIGTDGAGCIYIGTENKMTPIHVDNLFFPIKDPEDSV